MSNVVANLITTLANWKQGYKTSEFWVAIAPAVIGVLGVLGVHVANGTTTHLIVIVWGAVAAVYIAARTFIKSVHLGHAANLAALLHQVETDVVSVAKDVENNPVQEVQVPTQVGV